MPKLLHVNFDPTSPHHAQNPSNLLSSTHFHHSNFLTFTPNFYLTFHPQSPSLPLQLSLPQPPNHQFPLLSATHQNLILFKNFPRAPRNTPRSPPGPASGRRLQRALRAALRARPPADAAPACASGAALRAMPPAKECALQDQIPPVYHTANVFA